MSSQNLVFDPKDKSDSRPLVEIIIARLGGKLRADEKTGYTLYCIEDWVYHVSGSHLKDRGEPWRELKERMENNYAIDGHILIDTGRFSGARGSTVELDGCDDYGLYYIFQFIDQGITNDTIKAVRRYLAAAGEGVDRMRLNPEDAVDFAIEQYRRMGKNDQWIRNRLQGKIAREQFMYALTIAVIDIQKTHYGIATNRLYHGLWGRTTEVLRDQLNLSRGDNLRDHLSDMALLVLAMAETMCAEDLPDDESITFDRASEIVYAVAKDMAVHVKLLEKRRGGRDMITGQERLSDNDPYHDMIEQYGQRTINDQGFYIRPKRQLKDRND